MSCGHHVTKGRSEDSTAGSISECPCGSIMFQVSGDLPSRPSSTRARGPLFIISSNPRKSGNNPYKSIGRSFNSPLPSPQSPSKRYFGIQSLCLLLTLKTIHEIPFAPCRLASSPAVARSLINTLPYQPKQTTPTPLIHSPILSTSFITHHVSTQSPPSNPQFQPRQPNPLQTHPPPST